MIDLALRIKLDSKMAKKVPKEVKTAYIPIKTSDVQPVEIMKRQLRHYLKETPEYKTQRYEKILKQSHWNDAKSCYCKYMISKIRNFYMK